MIFLIMTLVILVFVVLWTFDLHKILYGKARTQNGGDAAAVAAARWQGITLNLIGDLNLLHAMALMTSTNDATIAAITNVQARLCFTGPLVGLMAAQQAAKNNGIYVNEGFTQLMREHVDRVRASYGQLDESGDVMFPEPYPGAWSDYAAMLEVIADDGIAAGPDNAHLYTDYASSHPLLMVEFYEAIAGRIWCWFFINQPGLLESYQSHSSWGALPDISQAQQFNSEIFGLGLVKRVASLAGMGADEMTDAVVQNRFGQDLMSQALNQEAAWYCYGSAWSNWGAMSISGEDHFPGVGPVKAQYNYAGADVAVRIESLVERVTPGSEGAAQTNSLVWTAAAKPFGSLNTTERPDAYGLVLPAYDDVRLIPVDASSRTSGGSFNVAWQRHIREHLTDYHQSGPGSFACWYCDQLRLWEMDGFRRSGEEWLDDNSGQCQNYPPGPGPGGGSRTGH